ncbi:MAG: ROK family protein [Phycisphaeraceae bacterium]
MIASRQRILLQTLWNEGPLSRWELHERTGIRPNTVGADTAALLDDGILREGKPTSTPRGKGKPKESGIDLNGKGRRMRGRPRVPLEIDTDRRHVLGLAIRPGRVELARLNLQGELLAPPSDRPISDAGRLIRAARDLMKENLDENTLCVGLCTPGFVDPGKHAILLSSAWPGQGEVSLQPIYETAGKTPYILENDMHALAARWMLAHRAEQSEDVLLVYFDDGQLGSALLVNGRPNRGCVTAANELGHTRMPVETERCYCGHVGCLERICSTDFLVRQGRKKGTLRDRAGDFNHSDEAMSKLIELLAMGISNAANFTRANRLVLVSELTQYQTFADAIVDSVRGQMLAEVSARIEIDLWNHPASQNAENAGWLALASLYCDGWMASDGTAAAELAGAAEVD